jgi:hypothetical protein
LGKVCLWNEMNEMNEKWVNEWMNEKNEWKLMNEWKKWVKINE